MHNVDHFKLHNDRYGHPTADQVLRAVGAVIATAIAAVDGSGYRYGGDEFALIVPDGNSVQEKEIRHSLATGTTSISLPGEIRVSVSIGAAFFRRTPRPMAPFSLPQTRRYVWRRTGSRASRRGLNEVNSPLGRRPGASTRGPQGRLRVLSHPLP
jgi:GGDEF domain-containing protein